MKETLQTCSSIKNAVLQSLLHCQKSILVPSADSAWRRLDRGKIIADSAQRCASYRMRSYTEPYNDCKLQNNRKKRSLSTTKAFCQNLQNLKPRQTGEK